MVPQPLPRALAARAGEVEMRGIEGEGDRVGGMHSVPPRSPSPSALPRLDLSHFAGEV